MSFAFWVLIGLFVVMGFVSRFVVDTFNKIVYGFNTKARLAMAAILVALSTSLPELSVSIASILEGKQELALGTLLGSNVVNLSIIIGGASILVGTLPIIGDFWRFEFISTFLAGLAPLFLMMDGELSRLDGLVLLVIYFIYLSDLIMDGKKKKLNKSGVIDDGLFHVVMKRRSHFGYRGVVELVLGLVAMMVLADLIVRLSVFLTIGWGVGSNVVGFLAVSLGTSLPELFLSMEALKQRNAPLALGNILGSVVTNATLIAGLMAFIRPFKIASIQSYSFAHVFFVIIFGLFWTFSASKKKLERWEGLVLVGMYFIFSGLVLLFPF